jgi:hypothetical protein
MVGNFFDPLFFSSDRKIINTLGRKHGSGMQKNKTSGLREQKTGSTFSSLAAAHPPESKKQAFLYCKSEHFRTDLTGRIFFRQNFLLKTSPGLLGLM